MVCPPWRAPEPSGFGQGGTTSRLTPSSAAPSPTPSSARCRPRLGFRARSCATCWPPPTFQNPTFACGSTAKVRREPSDRPTAGSCLLRPTSPPSPSRPLAPLCPRPTDVSLESHEKLVDLFYTLANGKLREKPAADDASLHPHGQLTINKMIFSRVEASGTSNVRASLCASNALRCCFPWPRLTAPFAPRIVPRRVGREKEEAKRRHTQAHQGLSSQAGVRRPCACFHRPANPPTPLLPLHRSRLIRAASHAPFSASASAGGRGLTSSRWQKRWCDFSDGVFRYSSAIGSKPNEIRLEDMVSVSPLVEQERVSPGGPQKRPQRQRARRRSTLVSSQDARHYTFEIRTSSKRGTYVLSAEKEEEYKKVRATRGRHPMHSVPPCAVCASHLTSTLSPVCSGSMCWSGPSSRLKRWAFCTARRRALAGGAPPGAAAGLSCVDSSFSCTRTSRKTSPRTRSACWRPRASRSCHTTYVTGPGADVAFGVDTWTRPTAGLPRAPLLHRPIRMVSPPPLPDPHPPSPPPASSTPYAPGL